MLFFTQTRLGGLGGEGLGRTTLKLLAASAAMSAALLFLPHFALAGGFLQELAVVIMPIAVGVAVYVFILKVLRVRELDQMWGVVRARLPRLRTG
jgi:hypothetical protein